MIRLGTCLKKITTANQIRSNNRSGMVMKVQQNGNTVFLTTTQIRKLAQAVKNLE